MGNISNTPPIGMLLDSDEPLGLDTSGADGHRIVITAQPGAGKSFLARGILENVTSVSNCARIPVCVIDSEGEFGSLKDAFPAEFVRLGGEEADMPVTMDSVAMVAELVAIHGRSVIIDVSGLGEAEREATVAVIAESLMAIPVGKGRPCMLFIDEAHRFAGETQRGTRCCKALQEISRAGRKRGLWLMVATQRPSALSKDVLTQSNIRFVGRTSGDTDLPRLKKELGLTREQADRLPKLERGTFLVSGHDITPHASFMRAAKPQSLPASTTAMATFAEPIPVDVAIAFLSSGSVRSVAAAPSPQIIVPENRNEDLSDDVDEILRLLAGAPGLKLKRDAVAVLTGWPHRGKRLADALEAGKDGGRLRVTAADYVTASREAIEGFEPECPFERLAKLRSGLSPLGDQILAVLFGVATGLGKQEIADRFGLSRRSIRLGREIEALRKRRLIRARRDAFAIVPSIAKLLNR